MGGETAQNMCRCALKHQHHFSFLCLMLNSKSNYGDSHCIQQAGQLNEDGRNVCVSMENQQISDPMQAWKVHALG